MKFVLILLSLLVTLTFAQGESAPGFLKDELQKPSQMELIRRARNVLLESLKKNDLQRAGEALDYLKEKRKEANSLTAMEEFALDMEIGRYADGIRGYADIMRSIFDSSYTDTRKDNFEVDDNLNKYLQEKNGEATRERVDSLINLIEASDVDRESKDLYATLMYLGLAIYVHVEPGAERQLDVSFFVRDTACTRVFLKRAKKFIDHYPYSEHSRYFKDQLVPAVESSLDITVKYMKDPWTFKYYTGGLGVFVGKWAGFIAGTDDLESKMKFSLMFEASLQIWRISATFLYSSGLLTYATYLEKDPYMDKTADEAYGLNIGYTLFDSQYLKVEPFLGLGTYYFLTIDDQGPSNCGECSSNVVALGANVDLRFAMTKPSEGLGLSAAFILRFKYMAQFGSFYDDCSSSKVHDEGFIVNTFGLSFGVFLW